MISLLRVGEQGVALFSDHNHILDPDSEASGQVDARFHRKHHSGLQDRCASGGDGRQLVYLQSQTVAGTVAEVVFVAVLRDELSGR